MSLQRKDQMAKRWVVFLAGMFLMGTAIALIIKAALGVAPISSFTTVFNKIWPQISLGTYSFLFSVLLFAGEFLLAPGRCKPGWFLQLVPSAISGVFIDVNMWLVGGLEPAGYFPRLAVLLAGCLIFGFSLALMVSADAILMPTEAFISVFAERFHLKWGNVKSGVDLVTVVFSCAVCLLAFHTVLFVREGTLISAVLIGQFCNLFQRWTDKIFLPVAPEAPAALQDSEG